MLNVGYSWNSCLPALPVLAAYRSIPMAARSSVTYERHLQGGVHVYQENNGGQYSVASHLYSGAAPDRTTFSLPLPLLACRKGVTKL